MWLYHWINEVSRYLTHLPHIETSENGLTGQNGRMEREINYRELKGD